MLLEHGEICFESVPWEKGGPFKVRFGDGSIVEIEGIGSILYVCMNGDHIVLAGVYLIPKLTTNIMSLGPSTWC
jgi:hypothetical protein